jgi:hypothetical protein
MDSTVIFVSVLKPENSNENEFTAVTEQIDGVGGGEIPVKTGVYTIFES